MAPRLKSVSVDGFEDSDSVFSSVLAQTGSTVVRELIRPDNANPAAEQPCTVAGAFRPFETMSVRMGWMES